MCYANINFVISNHLFMLFKQGHRPTRNTSRPICWKGFIAGTVTVLLLPFYRKGRPTPPTQQLKTRAPATVSRAPDSPPASTRRTTASTAPSTVSRAPDSPVATEPTEDLDGNEVKDLDDVPLKGESDSDVSYSSTELVVQRCSKKVIQIYDEGILFNCKKNYSSFQK